MKIALQITPRLAIGEEEIEERFVRASGPGGQNVNKLSTAVQLRFNLEGSASLRADVKERLARIAGKRMTSDGFLVINAQRFRTQERNRQDALDRLAELIRQALPPPVPRRATKPTLASKKRRIEGKKQRSAIKQLRGKPTD